MSLRDEPIPAEKLRVMQIVAAAIIAGALGFAGVAYFLVQNAGQGMAPPAGLPLVTWVAMGLLLINAGPAWFLPHFMTRRFLQEQKGQFDRDRLLALKQTTLILSLAFWEGSAFTGCLAYLLEAQDLALMVVAIALTSMILVFPTETSLRNWLGRLEEQEGT